VRVKICIVRIEYWLVSKNRSNHNEFLKTDATQYMILPQIRVSFPKLNDTIVEQGYIYRIDVFYFNNKALNVSSSITPKKASKSNAV
jgi:CYTH domain-containing protein